MNAYRASLVVAVTGVLALASSSACTTTSTLGENPDGLGSEANGTGNPDHGPGPGPTTPTPSPAPPTPPTSADAKGVAAISVRAEQLLGPVDPFSGAQPGYTVVRVVLRDQDVAEVVASGSAGACTPRLNNPNAKELGHAIDRPLTITATAAGHTKPMTFDASYHSFTGTFSPALPDGTVIAVTFGGEIPALAGTTVSLPARTTTLLAPVLKPHAGVRELRGYTAGADLPIAWTAVAGEKWIMGADASNPVVNLVDCFPAGTDSAFTVPASAMSNITAGDPDTKFPNVIFMTREEKIEQVGAIKVRKVSTAELIFQLNMSP
jgi:hypothetical protein